MGMNLSDRVLFACDEVRGAALAFCAEHGHGPEAVGNVLPAFVARSGEFFELLWNALRFAYIGADRRTETRDRIALLTRAWNRTRRPATWRRPARGRRACWTRGYHAAAALRLLAMTRRLEVAAGQTGD